MTVPNVTMKWCINHATCQHCNTYVEAGTPLVTVFFWNRGGPDHKGYNVKKYYHPQCWIEQGLDYLKANPYIRHTPKKKLNLTSEESELRYKLLKRKASIDQRLRGLDMEYPDNLLVEARLRQNIIELMLQIAVVGGIPKKWLTPAA